MVLFKFFAEFHMNYLFTEKDELKNVLFASYSTLDSPLHTKYLFDGAIIGIREGEAP